MKKVIIKSLTEEEIIEMGIKHWPVWKKEISTFDWSYESDEQCLILEGEVKISSPEGEYKIQSGDFVTFKKGLHCKWEIKKAIRKHYKFD